MKLKAGQVYTKPMYLHPKYTSWLKIRRLISFENYTFVIYDVWTDAPYTGPAPSPTRPPFVKELNLFIKQNKEYNWTLT